jgi:hypothetical protein
MNMIDQKKRTYHFETSTLLQLKLALIQAEKESPSRPPKEQKDGSEELALKLIASMRKKYRKAMSLRGAVGRVALSVLREGRIETKATKQSPRQCGDCFVGLRPPRNDTRLEP